VRKDLSLFGSFGKRGTGYSVKELLREIRTILGLDRSWKVALVGAGKLGSALFSYRDFEARGFRICAVFDADPDKVGASWGGLTVRADEEMDRVLREEEVDIAIVAVPADAAQGVVDRVVGRRGPLDPQLRAGAAAGSQPGHPPQRGRDAGAGRLSFGLNAR
jgi:redox-sensing transcriptional repressor